MIVAFIGLLGQGKTLAMTTFAKELHDTQGRKVMSNYKVRFGEPVNPIDLIGFEIEDCVLLLDEAYTLLDSRYNSQAARHIGYFLKQTRKRSVDVYYTSQRFKDVDIRLRQITDRVVVCFKYPDQGFLYVITESGVEISRVWLEWEKAETIFPLYDTTEIIMPMSVRDEVTSIAHLKELLAATTNMQTFVTLVRSENPYITKETIQGLYTLLRAGKDELAQKLLTPSSKDKNKKWGEEKEKETVT
jgi:hypothetical protein